MVKSFVSNLVENSEVNPDNIKKICSYVNYDLSLKVMEMMVDRDEMKIDDFRELPEVKNIWTAIDVIKENYL